MMENVMLVVMGLVGLSLLFVLIRTVQGKPVGRRIVFLYVGMAVVGSFFLKLPAPVPDTQEVSQLVAALDAIPSGSKVLASFDYDPQSAPELQPMAIAFLRYAFKRDLDVIIMGLWPGGPQQANMALVDAMEDPAVAAKNLVYGTDYVNLGFQSGNEFVIQSMGTEFRAMFPQDDKRTPYDQIPILQGVTNFSDVAFVMNFSSGKPGTREWVQIGVDRFGVKLGAGNTAVQAPEMYPFLRAGQLKGLVGGMTGAAGFEKTLKEVGKATTFVLSQMFAHATVMAFIIMGNIAYFVSRRRGERK